MNSQLFFILYIEVNTLYVSAVVCALGCCKVTLRTLLVIYLIMNSLNVYLQILITLGFEVTLGT